MAQSSVVIKVKYGDTLRRFSALINEDQQLDLDMERLRTKICSLYNFTPDSDFILTYIDEDDDRVTLADDEDLYDVVRQDLNPVRIFVHLNVDKSAQNSGKKSTESSTPKGSPSQTPQNINPRVAEILKSVPEPLCDALSKLSLELASKAATTPIIEDLINSLSKASQSFVNASASSSGTSSMVSSREKDGTYADEGMKQDEIHVSSSEQPTAVSSQVPVPHAVKGARLKFRSPHHPCLQLRKGKHPSFGHLRYMSMGDGSKKDKEIIEDSNGKFENNNNDTKLTTDDLIKKVKGIMGEKQLEAREAPSERHVSSKKETSEAKLGVNKSASGSYPVGECLFSRVPLIPTPEQASHMRRIIQPSNRSPNYSSDVTGSIFHTSVHCDGCGVVPITGPRFKSKVKHNYDLCTICFSRMGNDADYDRLDFPLPRHHLRASKGSYNPIFRNLPSMPVPSMMRKRGSNNLRPRLDSHFIMDVNVWDGTLMAPSTPFTKIWRMQNNGTLPWARGLQLVWIGGDRFNASDCVEIEIPEEGVNVSVEIDIAVDFIAPELPGRYNSYWRMSDPNGHKFGQRVWVLIEVDASLVNSSDKPSPVNASFTSPIMDLNLPPGNVGFSSEEAECSHILDFNLDMNVEAEGDLSSAPKTTPPRVDPAFDVRSSQKESIAVMVEHHKRRIEMEEMNFPINNDLLVASKESSSSSPISYPEIDVIYPQKPANYSSVPITTVSSSSTPQPCPTSLPFLFSGADADKPASASSSVTYPIIDINGESLSSPVVAGKDDEKRENDMEETLLKELKEMGFDEVNLNKEVLRVNEYDLERSVDELCDVAGWDPILEELKEMGFEDKETNKKLLVKYNGSLTRVVMDLITGEKQMESFLGC